MRGLGAPGAALMNIIRTLTIALPIGVCATAGPENTGTSRSADHRAAPLGDTQYVALVIIPIFVPLTRIHSYFSFSNDMRILVRFLDLIL